MIRFVRQHRVRVVIGAVLFFAVASVLPFIVPMLQERALAKEMIEAGGTVQFGYFGPRWVPSFLQPRIMYVSSVAIGDAKRLDKQLHLLTGFRKLWRLDVGDAQLSKSDWQAIDRLPQITRIDLRGERVTDGNLESLASMTHITWIILEDTHTTPEGRDRLRNALQNCWIAPYP